METKYRIGFISPDLRFPWCIEKWSRGKWRGVWGLTGLTYTAASFYLENKDLMLRKAKAEKIKLISLLAFTVFLLFIAVWLAA